MKRILVFGGFGFLGYYLLKELLSRNYNVVVADIKDNDEFKEVLDYIKCDISDQKQVEAVLKIKNMMLFIIWRVLLI